MDNKVAMRVVTTATMTTLDLIANMGGTLGLCCGFSVLSGVEILYWAAKALGGKRRKKGNSTT